MGAEVPVGEQHRHRGGDDRQRENQQHRVGQHRPHEQRQPPPAQAGGAHVGDRRVEVDRPDERGEPGEVDQVDPSVLAAGGGEEGVGERRVAGPTGFRGVPEDRGVEDDPAGQQQPEGERVQARVGHVARADHQRQEVVGEARHHWHDEQEDHRGAVHREQLVVGLGGDEVVVGHPELQADHQRLGAAEDEEHEREDHVHDPDALVVGGRQPAREAALLALDAVGDYLGCGGGVGGHGCLLSLALSRIRCSWIWVWCGLGAFRLSVSVGKPVEVGNGWGRGVEGGGGGPALPLPPLGVLDLPGAALAV